MEESRIGVYICECGVNIAATVDVPAVVEMAAQLPNVTIARQLKYSCAESGQQAIQEDIRDLGVNRVVVASCTPRMHEPTFQRALAEGGLNPYYFEQANIREQCSWVTKDPEEATQKSKALVAAAVSRVRHHQSLVPNRVVINPATLVVGGGIAGIQAALELADADYPVFLVEREPSIGGRMAQLDETFPTLDCSA